MTLPDFDPTPSYLVFGATGGIGSELCRHLAAQGARLVLAGRNEEKLRALSEELRGFAYPLDATHFEEVDACVERALELQTRLDGIACCVGSLLLKPAHATGPTEWETTIATNLTSAFRSGAGWGSRDDERWRVDCPRVFRCRSGWPCQPRGHCRRKGWGHWPCFVCGGFVRRTGNPGQLRGTRIGTHVLDCPSAQQ